MEGSLLKCSRTNKQKQRILGATEKMGGSGVDMGEGEGIGESEEKIVKRL